ncbi:calcium channel protein [Blastocladiella emersonii ATCC 22665]|nr:calcium channel protein [Blastocladiella emersonii ATCC 22665]
MTAPPPPPPRGRGDNDGAVPDDPSAAASSSATPATRPRPPHIQIRAPTDFDLSRAHLPVYDLEEVLSPAVPLSPSANRGHHHHLHLNLRRLSRGSASTDGDAGSASGVSPPASPTSNAYLGRQRGVSTGPAAADIARLDVGGGGSDPSPRARSRSQSPASSSSAGGASARSASPRPRGLSGTSDAEHQTPNTPATGISAMAHEWLARNPWDRRGPRGHRPQTLTALNPSTVTPQGVEVSLPIHALAPTLHSSPSAAPATAGTSMARTTGSLDAVPVDPTFITSGPAVIANSTLPRSVVGTLTRSASEMADRSSSSPAAAPPTPRNAMLVGLGNIAARIMGDERDHAHLSLSRAVSTAAQFRRPTATPVSAPSPALSNATAAMPAPSPKPTIISMFTSAVAAAAPPMPGTPSSASAHLAPPGTPVVCGPGHYAAHISTAAAAGAPASVVVDGVSMPVPPVPSTPVAAPGQIIVEPPPLPPRRPSAVSIGAGVPPPLPPRPAQQQQPRPAIVVIKGLGLLGNTLFYFHPHHAVRHVATRIVTSKRSKLAMMLVIAAHWVLMALRTWSQGEANQFTLFTSPYETALLAVFAAYTIEIVLKIITFGAFRLPKLPPGLAEDADADGDGEDDAESIHDDQKPDGGIDQVAAELNEEAEMLAAVNEAAAVVAAQQMDEAPVPDPLDVAESGATTAVPAAQAPAAGSLRRKPSSSLTPTTGSLHRKPSSLAPAGSLRRPSNASSSQPRWRDRGLSPTDMPEPPPAPSSLPRRESEEGSDSNSDDDGTRSIRSSKSVASSVKYAQATLSETIHLADGPERANGVHAAEPCVVVKPYLRSMFNRFDALAVLAFWAYVVCGVAGWTGPLWILRGLSSLRTFRFLAVTRGTRMILASLKASRRLLRNVIVFTGFIFTILAVSAVLAFKTSFRRQCVLDGTPVSPVKYCGKFYLQNGDAALPMLPPDQLAALNARNGTLPPSATSLVYKGYGCPFPQQCWLMQPNPYDGFASFDTIGNALLVQFSVMSGENWSGFMYGLMQAESKAAAIYFVVVQALLSYLVLQLFVATISETFGSVRAVYLEQKRLAQIAAFSPPPPSGHLSTNDLFGTGGLPGDGATFRAKFDRWLARVRMQARRLHRSRLWNVVFFVVLGLYSILMAVLAGLGSDPTLPQIMAAVRPIEALFTVIFASEVLLNYLVAPSLARFLATHPCDTLLALVTLVLLGFPFNRYLVGFEVARTYKLVTYLPPVRELIMSTKQFIGIGAVITFAFVALAASATSCMQMFGGVYETESKWMMFNDFGSAWLSVYSGLFTGDAWTDYLWGAMKAHQDLPVFGPAVASLAIISIFSLNTYVILNLFIVVILDIFETEDDEKRRRQVEMADAKEAAATAAAAAAAAGVTGLAGTAANNLGQTLAHFHVPAQSVFRRWALEIRQWWYGVQERRRARHGENGFGGGTQLGKSSPGLDTSTAALTQSPSVSNLRIGSGSDDAVAMSPLGNDAKLPIPDDNDANVPDRGHKGKASLAHLGRPGGGGAVPPIDPAAGPLTASNLYLNRQSMVFYSFTENVLQSTLARPQKHARSQNPVVAALQALIESRVFIAFIFLTILASIVAAALDSPMDRLYRLRSRAGNDAPDAVSAANWGDWIFVTDVLTVAIFSVEFALKIGALGYTYFFDKWNNLDFVVLTTMAASFFVDQSSAHVIRMARALRPLRVISYLPGVQSIFAALVLGLPRILSAIGFTMLVLFPYALYGMFLFSGRLMRCNDASVASRAACVGMYANDVGVWVPRVWGNVKSSFNWDSLGNALLTLFVMASKEGWTALMNQTQAIVGPGLQPVASPADAPRGSWWHAAYGVSFMLIGSVYTLNVFIGVVVRSFDESTGMAYLTNPQKAWNNVAKRIAALRPKALRPPNHQRWVLGQWVVWLQRQYGRVLYQVVTATMVIHMLLLCSEHADQPDWLDRVKEHAFIVFVALYLVEMLMLIVAMGPRSYFKKSWWNWYDSAITSLALGFVLAQLFVDDPYFTRLQKLFLVGYALRLARRVAGLHTLFATVGASLKDIARVYVVLAIVLLFFALVFTELFGLTRFGNAFTDYSSFRTVPFSLLLLWRMLTGDDWPSIMHEVKITSPGCVAGSYLASDCGNRGLAFTLFIVYFVLCTYLILNLTIALLVDSFDYVFSTTYHTAISEDDLKSFRLVWATVDPRGTGRIRAESITTLLARLRGPFDFRIYGTEFSVNRLMSQWAAQDRGALHAHHGGTRGVFEEERDFERDFSGHLAAASGVGLHPAVAMALGELDQKTVRARRRRYNILYYDLHEQARGGWLSFQDALMTLCLHVIPLEDYLTFEQYKMRVDDLNRISLHVSRVRFAGLFKMAVERRRFRRKVAEMHGNAATATVAGSGGGGARAFPH